MQKGKDYIGVGCGALIVNENNEVLLTKRGEKSRNNIGAWTQPGGSVEFGEKIEDAILREIREEVGVDIELLRLLVVTSHIMPEEGQHWVPATYLAKIKSGEPKNLEPGKISEVKWFNINEVPENLTQPTQESIDALKEILKSGK